jgi:hypothetical protein
MEIEPKPVMVWAGQGMTHTHQRLIYLAIDSMDNDVHLGMSGLVTDDED